MEVNVLQQIFDQISSYLPKNWRKFALYVSFVGTMSNPKLFIDMGNGYTDCYHNGYRKQDLLQLFFAIEEILTDERKSLIDSKRWSVFTMIVDNDGKVTADYDYTDISESFIEHQLNWIENHIHL